MIFWSRPIMNSIIWLLVLSVWELYCIQLIIIIYWLLWTIFPHSLSLSESRCQHLSMTIPVVMSPKPNCSFTDFLSNIFVKVRPWASPGLMSSPQPCSGPPGGCWAPAAPCAGGARVCEGGVRRRLAASRHPRGLQLEQNRQHKGYHGQRWQTGEILSGEMIIKCCPQMPPAVL